MKQFMDPYGTHLPLLLACAGLVDGPILELGCGEYSTFALHEICRWKERLLVSLEQNPEWLERFLPLQTPWHLVERVDNWAGCQRVDSELWKLAFVDHNDGARRYLEIGRLAKVPLVVVHDTENRDYIYDLILPKFKYAYTDSRFSPWTTVVSNSIDVGKAFGCPGFFYQRVGLPPGCKEPT